MARCGDHQTICSPWPDQAEAMNGEEAGERQRYRGDPCDLGLGHARIMPVPEPQPLLVSGTGR